MTYARPEDVARKLRFIGDEFSDTDLQDELEEANRKLRMNIGKNYIQRIIIEEYEEDEDKKTFDLDFSPILSIDKILKSEAGDVETLDSSNYTLNGENGTVTFTSSFDINITLELYYIPEIFKDLEVLYACKSILLLSSIVTGDEMAKEKLEDFEKHIKNLENRINTRSRPIAVRDHKSNISRRI